MSGVFRRRVRKGTSSRWSRSRRHLPQRFVSKSGHAQCSTSESHKPGIPRFRRFITEDGAVYGTTHGLTIAHGIPSASAIWNPSSAKRLMTKRLSHSVPVFPKVVSSARTHSSRWSSSLTVGSAPIGVTDGRVRNSMCLTPDAFN